ncbi:MAG: hypothetical protein HY582_00500 [Candidatus Omnitrophica bacterium]|nr:hypothetical protein [Candidatus Omnitrophota bacterium]
MANKIFVSILVLSLIVIPRLAAEPIRVDHVEAELVSEVKSIKPGEPFWVAVRLVMDEGWHTYWQNPGDSGLATSVKWKLPEGMTGGQLEWPYPKKIESASFVTYGYENEVLLLTKMEPDNSLSVGSSQMIQAKVDWLSCQEICVPGYVDLQITLPVFGEEAPAFNLEWQPKFIETKERLPVQVKDWGFDFKKVGTRLLGKVVVPNDVVLDWGKVQFFPLDQGVISYAAPQKFGKGKSESSFEMELLLPATFEKPLTRLKGVLVSKNGWWTGDEKQAVLIDAPVLEISWMDHILESIQSRFKKGDSQ